MIEVENVQPTAREFRGFSSGWGVLHWLGLAPMFAFPLGLFVFWLLAMGQDGDRVPLPLFLAVVVTAVLLWAGGHAVMVRVAMHSIRRSPAGALPWRWRIDADGLVFDTPLQCNQLDWRGVKSVVEEGDRFLFLVTPALTPVLPKRLLSAEQTTELRALIAEVTASGRLGAGA